MLYVLGLSSVFLREDTEFVGSEWSNIFTPSHATQATHHFRNIASRISHRDQTINKTSNYSSFQWEMRGNDRTLLQILLVWVVITVISVVYVPWELENEIFPDHHGLLRQKPLEQNTHQETTRGNKKIRAKKGGQEERLDGNQTQSGHVTQLIFCIKNCLLYCTPSGSISIGSCSSLLN